MILAPGAGRGSVSRASAGATADEILAAPTPAPPSGLYVHVPFCVSICPYCDFVVYAGKAARGPERRVDRFVEAVETELRLRADALDSRWGPPDSPGSRPPGARPPVAPHRPGPPASRPPLETLYLGGGTPSLLPPASLARLIGLVRERYGLAEGAEVTLEANPGPGERGDAGEIRAAGVTRLSIGAQSFEPEELRALGRRHSAADIAAAVAAARAAGFESVSLDLLYDVPGQTLDSWRRSVDAAVALAPDHVSMYALTLDDPDAEGLTGAGGDHHPPRRGARRWREQARRVQDEDRAAAMYELADDRMAAAGLQWYEISNWARPGHAARHNLGYWQGRPWEAVGPGAHAFDGQVRRWNAAQLDAYLAALLPPERGADSLPPGGTERSAAGGGERAMLALRTSRGLAEEALDDPGLAGGLRWAIDAALLDHAADRLVLTRRGRLLSNEVFARLV